jgi:hypothetical protein
MTNILEAICNIIETQSFELERSSVSASNNRANSMGEALENYVKDAFGNTLNESSEVERMKIFSQEFSWLGNQNHPPDIMIKGGDAIEVKKTESANSSLALNSSYPKSNILSSSPMITSDCKHCEEWTEKDLIYAVGHVSKNRLQSLWMVYGQIYAAKHPTYQRIKNTISTGIKGIPNVEFSETKELGRVNRVDPLGISNLRIRGMWQIENPRKVYHYLHEKTRADFELVVIIPLEKYESFNDDSKKRIEKIEDSNFTMEDTAVKDPNNPAKLIVCKLIKFLK